MEPLRRGEFARRPGAALRRALAALCCALLPGIAAAEPDEGPLVAAAADLQFAMAELAQRFEAETGRRVRVSFGSSGNLAMQIREGAPFELFLSADEDHVARLAEAGRTADGGALYAMGRIALLVPNGSPLAPDGSLVDLGRALADGRLKRLAIANPEHAPYGRAARAALMRAGLWPAIEGRLVLGENVAQAAQFAVSGAAQAGIVAYSLALAPAVSARGRFALIPGDWHPPLRQRMVLLKGAGETARGFYAFLQTPPARAILRRYGFVLPGETP